MKTLVAVVDEKLLQGVVLEGLLVVRWEHGNSGVIFEILRDPSGMRILSIARLPTWS